MHKSLIALAGAASIGLVSVARAEPGKRLVRRLRSGRGNVGGVAAGAIIGSAIANSPYYYPPPGYYYPPPPPGYYPPPPGLLPAASRSAIIHRLLGPGCAATCSGAGLCAAGARLPLGQA